MAIYLFILLLVISERVYASPFDEQQKRRERDMMERLKGIKDKLNVARDEGEYKRYREELMANNPDLARRINPDDINARRPRGRGEVRSQLEELQRLNVEEMKQLHRQQAAGGRPPLQGGLGRDSLRGGRPNPEELNKKLEEHRRVQAEIDEARRAQFKRHEMQLEHLRRQKLKDMDEAQRLREEARDRQKTREHDQVVHPGSRKQLEDVWKTQDGLGDENFNPRTFFFLHDVNADGVLDPYEVESLFLKEVRKVYGEDSDEIVMKEELAEMREHVMGEMDKNRDELISLDEFINYSNMKIFDIDEEWKPLSEKKVFSDEDIEKFEKYYDDYKYDYGDEGKKDDEQQRQEELQGDNNGGQDMQQHKEQEEVQQTDDGQQKVDEGPGKMDVQENEQQKMEVGAAGTNMDEQKNDGQQPVQVDQANN